MPKINNPSQVSFLKRPVKTIWFVPWRQMWILNWPLNLKVIVSGTRNAITCNLSSNDRRSTLGAYSPAPKKKSDHMLPGAICCASLLPFALLRIGNTWTSG
ncbi:hypothetical protein AVEN_78463-1 [Araneus ventricosus]|uniref:Uncharacterized protein n=1 Tax=Araneus ventricosus TaxID=182803 RepID=A0A4Y2P8E4_ARAVE|nr:hypothetical protein AVEN_78463-1 [Araneus ventricosus]